MVRKFGLSIVFSLNVGKLLGGIARILAWSIIVSFFLRGTCRGRLITFGR